MTEVGGVRRERDKNLQRLVSLDFHLSSSLSNIRKQNNYSVLKLSHIL